MRPSLLCCAWLIFSTVLFAQTDLSKLDELIRSNRFEELGTVLESLQQQHSQNSAVLFGKALLEPDGARAFSMLKNIADKYPHSAYADDAIFRMGHFYYALADWRRSRQMFFRLSKGHPQSDLIDEAQYFICRCVLAEGKVDSAYFFFQAFIRNNPKSPLVDTAVMDLETLAHKINSPDRAAAISAPKLSVRLYAIQIAAFSNFNNAQRARDALRRQFESVMLKEKHRDGKTFYAVLIGQFNSESDAKYFAKKHVRKIIEDYSIVDLADF